MERCPRAAERRARDAGMTQDLQPSPPTGRARGALRLRTRPWRCGTHEPAWRIGIPNGIFTLALRRAPPGAPERPPRAPPPRPRLLRRPPRRAAATPAGPSARPRAAQHGPLGLDARRQRRQGRKLPGVVRLGTSWGGASQSAQEPLQRIAGTLTRWCEPIVRYIRHRYSNGMTEGFNNKIKLI